MIRTPWLVQVYGMTDADSQELTAGLLRGMPSLAVDSVASGRGLFVIVEAPDALQARSVFNLVKLIDPGARLVNTTTAAVEKLAG
jgi:hypothetical protein